MDDQKNLYIQRVNAVLDHIATHLTAELSLRSLADIAGFSEFHFHRVFKAIVGETVNQCVWRVRVEHGAVLLRSKPGLRVSDAAAACGFTSLAGFSRAFKTRFGVSPAGWDRVSRLQNEPQSGDNTAHHITALPAVANTFTVKFRQMPAQRLAYIRIHDAYSDMRRIEDAYHTLLDWYAVRGGQLQNTTLYGMSQDDPDITPLGLCRFDWCLRVPDHWQADSVVSLRDFPACLLAIIPMHGENIATEARILDYFWRDWLPRSRFQPANLPAMEIYRRFPHEAGWWDTLYMDCAVPVTRL